MDVPISHKHTIPLFAAFCESKDSLEVICDGITGDAALYSMFRKHPEAGTVPCPFKSAPFSFSYNRGTGDCTYPLSRAESCTDDSRLVLKYQACTDVPSTESNGECVARLSVRLLSKTKSSALFEGGEIIVGVFQWRSWCV